MARSAELHSGRCFQVAGHRALDDDLTRFDIGFYFSVRPNGYFRLREVELPFGLAVNIEVVITRDLAVNSDS